MSVVTHHGSNNRVHWLVWHAVAVILYALSAVYFAGVMVRLMLTLTPVVCVLAAVAFSRVFSIYLRDDTRQSEVTDDTDEDKEKNDKYYDKVHFLI